MADINKVMEGRKELNLRIEGLLKLSSFYECDDLSGLDFDEKDSEQLFLVGELKMIMEKLLNVYDRISYISCPIKEVSKLYKNSDGRYETDGGITIPVGPE